MGGVSGLPLGRTVAASGEPALEHALPSACVRAFAFASVRTRADMTRARRAPCSACSYCRESRRSQSAGTVRPNGRPERVSRLTVWLPVDLLPNQQAGTVSN